MARQREQALATRGGELALLLGVVEAELLDIPLFVDLDGGGALLAVFATFVDRTNGDVWLPYSRTSKAARLQFRTAEQIRAARE